MDSIDFSDPIVIGMAAIGLAALVFALALPYLSNNKDSDRIKSVTTPRTRKVAARNAADVASNRKKAIADSLKDVEQRKNRSAEKANLRNRLMQAGLDIQPREYWLISATVGLAAAVLTYMNVPEKLGGAVFALAGIAGGVGMLGIPSFILNKMIKGRQAKFVANLANALDIVVRGVKTGLPLNECLGIIARETPEPIASEFKEVVDQQRLGVPLGEALDRLVTRMPLPEVKFLAIVISIQQSAGGNLSEALGNLAQVLRDRHSLKLKVKALSAEALASAMVLGSLPPMVILLLHLSSPSYLTPMFTTNTGAVMLGSGLFWMSCGILMMRKMINFKY